MAYFVIGLAAVFAGWFLTGRLIPFLLRYQIMDHPNERSFHTTPIPRGGGLSIVFLFLLTLPFFAAYGGVAYADMAVLTVAGLVTAAIGIFDDIKGVPVVLRLILHILIVGGCVYFLGTPGVQVGGYMFEPGWWGLYILEFVVLLWVVNFFNFMDGIDMIAGVETVSIALSAGLILLVTAPQHEMIMPLIFLAAATAGFLIWNCAPARVFMGDVASGFLGLILGLIRV